MFKGFVIGVVLTLCVVNPITMKMYFGKAVDTANATYTDITATSAVQNAYNTTTDAVNAITH